MANTATLSSKFQISIPKEIREKEKWKPGQKFAFVAKGGGYALVRIPTFDEMRGIAKGANPEGYRDRQDRY
mgnify:CR=1 FL=1